MEESPFDSGSFEAVWSRVNSGGDSAALCKQDDVLRGLIALADARRRAYCACAARFPAFSRALLPLAADEAKNLSRLQAEFFIASGDTCPTSPARPEQSSLSLCLRECFKSENETAKTCADAAGRAAEPRLKALFLALSDCAGRHANGVFAAVTRLMA